MKKGGGMCPDNAAPGKAAGAQCVWGGEGEGEGEVVEQQIRALGNPCSSFSSSSSSLCIRRGFDNKFHSRQCRTQPFLRTYSTVYMHLKICMLLCIVVTFYLNVDSQLSLSLVSFC